MKCRHPSLPLGTAGVKVEGWPGVHSHSYSKHFFTFLISPWQQAPSSRWLLGPPAAPAQLACLLLACLSLPVVG